jgi:hypothetical protein
MIPISTSRIYIFGAEYEKTDDEIVLYIYRLLKKYFPELTYKNIEIKFVKNLTSFSKEIHINHLFYAERRYFNLEISNQIRCRLIEVLQKLPFFRYKQLQFVNDGFDRQPSLGLSRSKLGE